MPYVFFVLACAFTWAADLPYLLALLRHEPPPAYALPLAGLGAFGPALAAFVLAFPRRELGVTFGRWRARPIWIVVGLFVPAAIHLPATLLEVLLGGEPQQWFYPPVRPEHFAALVLFSVGEELGRRGYAYPRLANRHGAVAGALLVGAVWGVWQLCMMFTPDKAPTATDVAIIAAELALYSVVLAWFYERSGRSLAVAIAVHAGAHLDNVHRAPESEVRLRILRFIMLAIAAGVAARALRRRTA